MHWHAAQPAQRAREGDHRPAGDRLEGGARRLRILRLLGQKGCAEHVDAVAAAPLRGIDDVRIALVLRGPRFRKHGQVRNAGDEGLAEHGSAHGARLCRRLPLMAFKLRESLHVAGPRGNNAALADAGALSGGLDLPRVRRLDGVSDGAGGAVRREDHAALAAPDVGRISLHGEARLLACARWNLTKR